MSQYFEYPIMASEDADKKMSTFQWCESESCLAVAYENGTVQFFQSEVI